MNEIVPNTFPGMFWSYLSFFALIFVYVLSLARRVKRLESSLKAPSLTNQEK